MSGGEAMAMELMRRIRESQALLTAAILTLENGGAEGADVEWPSLADIRRGYIKLVFEHTERSMNKTSHILGISRQTVGTALRGREKAESV